MNEIQNKNIPTHHLSFEEFQYATLENGHPENFDDVHRHNFFEIIWFEKTSSESILHIDFEKYSVSDHSICVLLPGQVFKMDLKEEKGHVLAISKEIFEEICLTESLQLKPIAPFIINKENIENCRSLITILSKEYLGRSRNNFIKAILRAFILLVTDKLSLQRSKNIDLQRIEFLTDLINENYTSQKETDFYAVSLNITTHHLNHIVRRLRGSTVKKLVSQRIVLEAKRELSYGQKSIKEIAYQLGFTDSSYFSRLFKKQTGFSPEIFKAENSRR